MPLDDQNELFVVVDENDTIIGYRTRYECHHNNKLIHRGIGVVIMNNQGHILIQKRSQTKDFYPGFYTISVGGHVGKGETYKQAAEREMQEELGIQVPIVEKAKFMMKSHSDTEIDTIFTASSEGPFNIDTHELTEVKFVAPIDLKKMRKSLTPFAIKSLEHLHLL